MNRKSSSLSSLVWLRFHIVNFPFALSSGKFVLQMKNEKIYENIHWWINCDFSTSDNFIYNSNVWREKLQLKLIEDKHQLFIKGVGKVYFVFTFWRDYVAHSKAYVRKKF